MKHFHFILLAAVLFTACQSAPTTSVPVASTLIAPTSQPTKISNSIGTSAQAPIPNGPTVHSTNADPNASDLIVVKDQFIVNNSLTFDSVNSAQAAFIVLYYDKQTKTRNLIGKLIAFVPVPAGKANQFVFPLTQDLAPTINIATLPGNPVFAVLQTNASNPNSIVHVNGKGVFVLFTILYSGKGRSAIFSTATP